jgi:hypothetical protein
MGGEEVKKLKILMNKGLTHPNENQIQLHGSYVHLHGSLVYFLAVPFFPTLDIDN